MVEPSPQLNGMKKYEDKLNLCNDCRCGFCREGCPVYFGTDKQSIVAPKGRNQAMSAFASGDIGFSDRLLDSAFICTTCGWCVEVCPQNNFLGHEGIKAPLHMPSLNTGFRDVLLKDHHSKMPGGAAYLCENVRKYDSCFRVSRKEKTRWAEGLDMPRKSSTVFFGSCMSVSMGTGEKLLRNSESLSDIGLDYENLTGIFRGLQKIQLDWVVTKLFSPFSRGASNEMYSNSLRTGAQCLKKLGVNCGYLGEDEPCCGAPFHTYGRYEEFGQHAKKVYKKLRDQGVTELVTLNPICGAIMRNYYPKFVPRFDIIVRHFSEVVSDRISETNPSMKLDKKSKVVFHDPCHLSRHQRIVNQPRKIIEAIDGVELEEPRRTKFNSRCSGCGGLEATHPGLAKKIAEDRTKELLETGADTIVTSCPACVMMIRIGAEKLGKKVDVVELSDLTWSALESSSKSQMAT